MSGVLEEVRGAVAVLERVVAELEPGTFDARGARELVAAFAHGERFCGAGKALAARRADETGVWKPDGHRSAAHWLASVTGTTVGAAFESLRTVRALDALPETADAYRAGELSAQQAAAITDAAREDPAAEESLLQTAQSSSLQGLRARCREARNATVDDATRARRLHESRYVHRWTDPDGAYRADVRLSPHAGAVFDAALEAHVDRIHSEARRIGLRQQRAAYAADALVALSADGPCKPVEVRLTIDHAAVVRGHAEPGGTSDINGIPVPVTIARSLLDDARVTVIARDGTDIRTISTPKRSIPAKLRRALEARYPVCGVTGCDNQYFLQIDHIVAIVDHGPTDIGNTWRICSHHHDLKTYCGWVVIGDGDSRTLVPPDDPEPPEP